MTTYRSGIRTVTRSFWQTCPVEGCGKESYRSKKVTGPNPEAELDAWQPDPRCYVHLRDARRAAVGL